MGLGYANVDPQLPPHVAYLTFDDGPSDWTLEFLDILKAKAIHATFFVTARQLKGKAGLDGTFVGATGQIGVFRDVVKRELDEGHVVGNHTVDHPDLATLTLQAVASELDDNEVMINQALVRAGAVPRLLTLLRAPFGSPWFVKKPGPLDIVAAETGVGGVIAQRGLNILWTLDSTDSREWGQGESFTRQPGQVQVAPDAPTYADKMTRIQQTVLGSPIVTAGHGVVILFHDTHDTTRDVLAAIIDGLRGQGYAFDTVESWARERWGRPSSTLTPGPGLFSTCQSESEWGCASDLSTVVGAPAPQVCGRLWRAWERLGGPSVLGAPTAAATIDQPTGVVFQSFERGVLELHPENPPPCDVEVAVSGP
jgi:peptidoglycan/xylan/chitin deacetylase (PgdA/CDA1 family)